MDSYRPVFHEPRIDEDSGAVSEAVRFECIMSTAAEAAHRFFECLADANTVYEPIRPKIQAKWYAVAPGTSHGTLFC